MKKLLSLITIASLILMFSCSASAPGSSAPAAETRAAAPEPAAAAPAPVQEVKADVPAAKALKVGFIATNLSAESQARTAKQFEKSAKAKGYEATILNSEGSIENQATQMENLIQMKVDAIVIAMAHPTEIKPAIEEANKAGIPVISISSGYMDGLVCDITSNDFVMGAKITSQLFDSLGQEGNIVVIKFVKNAGCRKRGEVLDAMLPEYPGIKVLDEYTVAGTARFMDDTQNAMETFATKYGDKIDAVWTAFDQLGYACSDVLQAQGYKDVLVTGVDGNEETFRRIKEGTFYATVAQPFEDMADKAIAIIEKIGSGAEPRAAAGGQIVYVDAPLVTAETL